MNDRWTCARNRRWRIVALAVVAALPPLHLDAAAQQQQAAQQMVPLELMETLSLNIYGGDEDPAILVGALPPGLAEAVPVPENARIIGSIAHANSSRSSLALPGEPETVRRDLEARFIAAGWEKFEPPEYGGFVNRAMPPGLVFCMGSMSVSAGAVENPRGGTYVVMMHMPRQGTSMCDREERYMPDRRSRTLVPSLRAPPGARIAGGSSGGGGGDHWRASARLETDRAIGELADHYDAQLREHRWTPLERVVAEAVALHTYRLFDEDGREWYGMLTVAAPSADAQRVLAVDVTLVDGSQR